MPEQRIVAIGGGDSHVVLDYVLSLVRASPRLLWVGTAGAEDAERALAIHDRFRGRADVQRVKFFPWPPSGLCELVLSQDLIVVGGGNSANMLAIWRVHDDEELRRPVYLRLVDEGFPAGYASYSGVGLHFAGTELVEVASPREGATAYRVEPGSETALEARLVS